MATRPEAQLPFDRDEWFHVARNRLRWGINTRVTKTCGHQFCDLTQSRCCACIDTRAPRSRYYRYVDGQGMVADAKRWHDYCPGCKLHHSADVGEETSPRPVPSESIIRCANCGEIGHALWDCSRITFDEEESTSANASETAASTASTIATQDTSQSTMSLQSPPSSPRPYFSRPSWLRTERHSNTNLTRATSPPPTNSRMSVSPTPTSSRMTLSPPRPLPRLTHHQQRRARAQAHFERSFGSLADIASDPDYVSPITSMYSNAYERFQEHERERRERQAANREHFPPTSPPTSNTEASQDYISQSSEITYGSGGGSWYSLDRRENPNTQQLLERLRRQLAEDDRQLLVGSDSDEQTTRDRDVEDYSHPPSIFGRWYSHINPPTLPINHSRRREQPPPRPKTPEPLAKEELTISDECKVCFSQHCDTLLLPCAHLALCEWCAKRTYPEITNRRVNSQCVICRGKVTKMMKVYRC